MTFTFFDILCFLLVFFFAVTASVSGFIKELFSKLAVVAGVVAAIYFGGTLAPYFAPIVSNTTVDLIFAFVVLFIAGFLAVKIIQIIASGLFNSEIMGSLNHILGFFFGLAEGAVIVSCVIILLKAQPWIDISAVTDKSFVVGVLSPYLETPVKKISGMFA